MDNKSNKLQASNTVSLTDLTVLIEDNDLPKEPVEVVIRPWDSFFLDSEGASGDFFNDRLPDDK